MSSTQLSLPQGYRLAAVHCGLKADPAKADLVLLVSDLPAAAAGVYTTNLVAAAPVVLDRGRTPGDGFRAVVINSGNANACTGERGARDAAQMAAWAAQACDALPEQALVLSTGVIGHFLPTDKISAGITAAAARLSASSEALEDAARGMMTTDSRPKLSGRQWTHGGREYRLVGLAKGAAMIGPRMATMLGVVLTDAPLGPSALAAALTEAVQDSFNCISVEGHMSTNDTVLLLANGAAGGSPLSGAAAAEFTAVLGELCQDLARQIPADGEGCTHLVTVQVRGCATRAAAFQIAKAIADSPLVKAAIAGADPNWGRVLSAAGYAGVPFDPEGVRLRLNGALLFERGSPVAFDEAAVSAALRARHETEIELDFREGDAAVRFWTTDMTEEYIRLNADYRT